jgi:hypothetical protein
MSKRTTSALCAVILTCIGAAAFAASSSGDDPTTTGHYEIVTPALSPAAAPAGATSRETVLERGTRRRPRVINLITTNPVSVPPGKSVAAELPCKKRQGIPIGGGVLAPPTVVTNVISRFSPEHPDRLKPRTYYVGVVNPTDQTEEFNATLICAKGIDQTLPR